MYGSQIEYIRPNLSHKPPEYHTDKIMFHKIGLCLVSHRILEYKQKRDKVQDPHSVYLHSTFTKYQKLCNQILVNQFPEKKSDSFLAIIRLHVSIFIPNDKRVMKA